MNEQRFDVTLPQSVAALTPLYIVPAIFSVQISHAVPVHTRWILIPIILIYVALVVTLAFVVARKKHLLIVKDDGITIGKVHLTPQEITSLRFNRRTLFIFTRHMGKRSQVAFDKRDAQIAVQTIAHFASQHKIKVEKRNVVNE